MGEAARAIVPPRGSGRLTRGLASLLARTMPGQEAGRGRKQFMEVPVALVSPNAYQPRRDFDEDALKDLAASVKESGVIQPIVVRRCPQAGGAGPKFELIAGERRLRAAKQAGLETVPAVIRDASEDEMLGLALVENVQRDNLNPMELARAYSLLIKRFGFKQEEVAARLGMSRPAVANTLRLLELPESIQEMLYAGKITAGHARAILSVAGEEGRVSLAREILEKGLSVRAAEARASRDGRSPARSGAGGRGAGERPAHLKSLEARLCERLGTKVTIIENKRKGKIVIEFYSNDDFERILEAVGAAA